MILLATAAVVAAGSLSHLQGFREIGGIVSTLVSGLFLLLVAAMNICILLAIVRTIRRVRAGYAIEEGELDTLFAGTGLLSPIFMPLFRSVTRPWQMGLLGFLFGLSFDAASEVALFGISATQVAHGVPFGSALVYPVLFAAGMSLLDTTDGVMMVSAYHSAVADPLRKLYYNMTITLMLIAVALFIGIVELSTLTVRWFGLTGPVARSMAILTNNLDYLGIVIVAVLALAWMTSIVTFRIVGRPSSAEPASG